jgi:hypothetical protein
MGDMGDLFRDWEEMKRQERQQRLEIANASDLPDWTKHTSYHWSRMVAGQRLNWWPSTARWSWGKKKNGKPEIFYGRQDDLLNFIRNREPA